jgi:ubiquinone/menaquinone biosynthesis C-methylase UbiE
LGIQRTLGEIQAGVIDMPIDFHDQSNQSSYASRDAEDHWIEVIQQFVDIKHKKVLDLGCGGGIYSKAMALSDAEHVIAMDFSTEMLKGAAENCLGIPNISFVEGNALKTGLEDDMIDVLLERAVIHHIKQLKLCFDEAYRVLKPKGKFIIQDRTPEDCSLPGSSHHIRGYFFEKFPRLLEEEINRRYSSEQVLDTLKESGFKVIKEMKYWETRKQYKDVEQLKDDLKNRMGRSILHELSGLELEELVDYITNRVEGLKDINEEDRWTIWIAEK